MRNFENLSKDEMLSIIQTISMYIDEAKYEDIKHEDSDWNDGFKSGVNSVCEAIQTFLGDK
jgi:hypothetical protein